MLGVTMQWTVHKDRSAKGPDKYLTLNMTGLLEKVTIEK